MTHIGIHEHRVLSNPLEGRLVLAWKHQQNCGPLLANLLTPPWEKGQSLPSDRDATVAATIIQWLGSPVGLAFLCENLGEEIVAAMEKF